MKSESCITISEWGPRYHKNGVDGYMGMAAGLGCLKRPPFFFLFFSYGRAVCERFELCELFIGYHGYVCVLIDS